MTVTAKISTREHDNDLLVAVAAGSRQALEELYLAYHRRLARFLSRFTSRYENVEEIINDTFMVVDRKSTRLNSSHANISYAVFCLKKKKTIQKDRNLVRACADVY